MGSELTPNLIHRQWFVIALVTLVCVTLLGVSLVIAGQAEAVIGLLAFVIGVSPIFFVIWGVSRLGR